MLLLTQLQLLIFFLTQEAEIACLPSAYRFIGDWTIAWKKAVGGKAWNEGRVNSCFVALIAT